jgi:hypothetical protein
MGYWVFNFYTPIGWRFCNFRPKAGQEKEDRVVPGDFPYNVNA